MSATTNLGKVSVTPKGAWAITNAYEILDIVTSGGSSYLAKQDVPTGVSLSNTSYWIMIAEKGDGGEVTSASASISGGYGTPGVTVTAGGTAHERTLAFAFTNLRGEKGETGNGIDSVYKTGTSGLVDTYTILFTDGSTYEFEVNNGTASIDDTLTKSGWAADAKAVGDTKASIDGFYETMGVGVADNLTPYSEDSGATQDIPFIAQGTGCGNGESVVDTGSYLQFKKKLGNTVCVNQLVNAMTSKAEVNGVTRTANNDGTKLTYHVTTCTSSTNYTAFAFGSYIPGHIYYVTLGNVSLPENTRLNLRAADRATTYVGELNSTPTNIGVYISAGVTDVDFTIELKIIDWSLWFGSTDNIPSDLLSHPENWGRYYAGSLAYAAGYLDSADGTVMKSIGRNVWDEEWLPLSTNRIESKNYCECIPGATYYACMTSHTDSIYWLNVLFFDDNKAQIGANNWCANAAVTAPANARYFKLLTNNSTYIYGNVYNHDITISLYYSGESGYDQYYPYSVLAEVDTGSEVLYGDGTEENSDVKLPSGAITRKRQRDNLGDIAWTLRATGSVNKLYSGSLTKNYLGYNSASEIAGKVITAPIAYAGISNAALLIAAVDTSDVGLYTLYNYGAATNAVYLVLPIAADPTDDRYIEYTVATPTTEQGTAFAENIPCDDFGSMYWTQTKGIPQGNEIFYPVDYKASIDTLYNRVEGDMGAIVIDSQLDVVADRIPEAPDTDGTYTLKATVSSGTKTYSWVADE